MALEPTDWPVLESMSDEVLDFMRRPDFLTTALGRWCVASKPIIPFSFTMPSGAQWTVEYADEGTFRVTCSRDGRRFVHYSAESGESK